MDRRLHLARLFVGTVLALTSRLAAQTAPPAAPICDSLLLRSPVTSVEDTLRLRLRPGVGMPALPRQWAELVLDELASRLRLPQPLALDVYDEAQPPLPPHLPMEIEPTLFDEVRMTVQRDGRLVSAELVTRSLVDAVDAALMTAIAAADSARALPPLPSSPVPTRPTPLAASPAASPAESPSDAIVVFLNLTRASLPEALQPLTGVPSRDLAKMVLPRLRGAEPVRPAPATIPPDYPESERIAGRDGRAVVQFVVDETGAVASGTTSVLTFTSLSFAVAALEFLPRARFVPASIGGCPIRQMVQQPFEFRLFPGTLRRP